jgi:hypothetical protein
MTAEKIVKKCEFCGNEFLQTGKRTHYYCTPGCARKGVRLKVLNFESTLRRDKYAAGNCAVCGKELPDVAYFKNNAGILVCPQNIFTESTCMDILRRDKSRKQTKTKAHVLASRAMGDEKAAPWRSTYCHQVRPFKGIHPKECALYCDTQGLNCYTGNCYKDKEEK